MVRENALEMHWRMQRKTLDPRGYNSRVQMQRNLDVTFFSLADNFNNGRPWPLPSDSGLMNPVLKGIEFSITSSASLCSVT